MTMHPDTRVPGPRPLTDAGEMHIASPALAFAPPPRAVRRSLAWHAAGLAARALAVAFLAAFAATLAALFVAAAGGAS